MPENTDKPERDTSPSGEISARQNEDGTYEIVAGESSSTNTVPEPEAARERKKSSSDPETKEEGASIRSPITIGLLVLTLLAAGGTVAYFAMGASGDDAEQTSGEEAPSFRPYAGDEALPDLAVEEAETREQPAAEADASLDEDAGPKQRETEIIVLEEGVDEDEPEESAQGGAGEAGVDPSQFQKIEVGPDTAARIRDSIRLKVDPAKLRDIKFTNGDIPEAEDQEVRDRNRDEVDSQGTMDDQPSEELEGQVEDPVIE